jgi:hypothetical protein
MKKCIYSGYAYHGRIAYVVPMLSNRIIVWTEKGLGDCVVFSQREFIETVDAIEGKK